MPAAEGVTSRAHARMLPAFDLIYRFTLPFGTKCMLLQGSKAEV